MSDLQYLLVILTHGRHGKWDTFERTLGSFLEHVSPRPSKLYIHQDGAGTPHYYGEGGLPSPLASHQSEKTIGYCAATAKAWQYASAEPFPYVFWLEHDFIFLREVDLHALALVLESDQRIAQMALVRGPANPAEEEAGGLIASRPGEFDAMCGGYDGKFVHPTAPWLRHRSFFTTNPSLMRREFMQRNPWPTDGQELCEGRYGIELVQRGYEFGYWGEGEQWVEHIGVRSGMGY